MPWPSRRSIPERVRAPPMRELPLVSPLDRALFLKAQPYLAGLPPRVVAALAEHTEERELRARDPIYERGTPPRELLFLSTGGVRLQYGEPGGIPPIDVRAPGGVGLMEHLARSEEPPAAWALEDTQALAMDLHVFMQLMEEDFQLYQAIARSLGRAVLGARHALGRRCPAEAGYPQGIPDTAPEPLDLVQKLVRAREAPFFRETNVTVLTELLRFQQPRRLSRDTTLWRQGDPVSSMALVLEGGFETHCADVALASPAGSMLGAWEIFALEPRAETAIATTESRILEIDRTHFTDVLEDRFEFALDYLGKLARETIRLRSISPEGRKEQ